MWTPHSSTPARVVTSAAALATALLAGPFATIALAAPSAASVPAPRAAASAPSAVRAAAATPPKDTRTGRRLDQPYTVGGIIVVSKAHRVSSRYRPAWARRPYGLRPDVYAAATRLLRAARQKKLTLTIRSGYRSYATQAASYRRAVARYPPPRAYADTYYAPAGASEHQTGLAFDVWDGRHRGTPSRGCRSRRGSPATPTRSASSSGTRRGRRRSPASAGNPGTCVTSAPPSRRDSARTRR